MIIFGIYLSPLLFPEIRHLIIDVETNSKYIEKSQLISKLRYYNNEKLSMSFPKNVIAKSVLINGEENINNVINNNQLEVIVRENVLIFIEFEFLVEVTTIKTGEGTISTDKQYYQGGEIVNINVLPDDGYLLGAVRVRFNNNEIVSLENNEEIYHYEIEGDIEEDDYLVAYVDFVKKDTGLQWWAIMLIVLASILGALIIVITIILIRRKYRNRMDEEHE